MHPLGIEYGTTVPEEGKAVADADPRVVGEFTVSNTLPFSECVRNRLLPAKIRQKL